MQGAFGILCVMNLDHVTTKFDRIVILQLTCLNFRELISEKIWLSISKCQLHIYYCACREPHPPRFVKQKVHDETTITKLLATFIRSICLVTMHDLH